MSVTGAASVGSAAATGSAPAVARAREALLVVSDLDDAETLQNCPEATQYVLTRFIQKLRAPYRLACSSSTHR